MGVARGGGGGGLPAPGKTQVPEGHQPVRIVVA